MQAPLVMRPPTDAERRALTAGLRSPNAIAQRRCQIVLGSARGEHVPAIGRALGCGEQTVRNAIHAFNREGLASLSRRSPRPRTIRAAFDGPAAERLRELLHRSPREFGHPTGLWTLELAAETCAREGVTRTRVSGETVRATLGRLGIRWRRAKRWITSPDPAYTEKNGAATA